MSEEQLIDDKLNAAAPAEIAQTSSSEQTLAPKKISDISAENSTNVDKSTSVANSINADKSTNADKKTYSAEDITVLSGLEPVRKRPGMFIGSTSVRGLHHLVYEAVDNSIDEAMAGYATKIRTVIHDNGFVTVEDNGRGIPVDNHAQYNIPALTVVMTMLHAGGKFEKGAYKVSGGLHGVGISVTNALSEKFIAEVKRNGKKYRQEYAKGTPLTDVLIVGEAQGTGTSVTFLPDKTIFETTVFDFSMLAQRLRELAYLNKGVEISIKDERTGVEEIYLSSAGLTDFVSYLNANKKILHKPLAFSKEKNDLIVEVALQYTAEYSEEVYTFANNINTHEGGTHLIGFKSALTRTFNNYSEKHNLLKDEMKLTSDDVREGLTAIISVKLSDPQFEGQTKTKLGNSEVKGVVDSVVFDTLMAYLEENPSVGKLIISKCVDAAHAREAARHARELVRRKSALENITLPGKLADCASKEMEKCELFIVEGDSAGGSGKQARNKETQAVLPLKGKILNVEKARLIKILKNDEVTNLITAVGTGLGDEFDLTKLRYGKIIVMTDADVDGNHIACLILTLLYRYMRPLIDAGRIFLAQPPLYKITKGKLVQYAYNEEQKLIAVKQLGGKIDQHKENDKEKIENIENTEDIKKEELKEAENLNKLNELENESDELETKISGGITLQRYKGLGEMNPEQLWETTMDPEKRVLKKITIEDAVIADQIFSMLMGDLVEPRREFILSHAREVRELDV